MSCRKEVFTVIILALGVASALGATCNDDSFLKGETCFKCADVENGGKANCRKCTYSADNGVVCSLCQNNYYFTLEKSCVQCRMDCYGGNCSDLKASGDVSKCTSCIDTFYLKSDGTCNQCDTGCKVCAGPGTCSVCALANNRPQRPDTGVCAECLAPNSLGFEGENEVCGPVPVLKTLASNEIIAVDNRISVAELCGPTVAANKAQEKVGAILTTGDPMASFSADDIKQMREMIRSNQASTVSAQDFGKLNRNYSSLNTIYVNIAGTDEGLGGFSGLKVFRGNSTLSYLCINAYNVRSQVRQVKVVNNATKNKDFRFKATFNKNLSTELLENLTCSVAIAFQIKPVSRVKNHLGRYCNDSVKARVLQDVLSGDVSFKVEASQLDDDSDSMMISKLAAFNETLVSFTKREGLQILGGAQVTSFGKGSTGVVPNITLNPVTSSKFITLSVVSNVEAVFSYGLTNKRGSLNLSQLLSLDASSNDTLFVGKIPLVAKVNQTINFTELTANTDYTLFHHAESVAESPKSTGLMILSLKTNSTTGSSSSESLLGTCLHIVLLISSVFIVINH